MEYTTVKRCFWFYRRSMHIIANLNVTFKKWPFYKPLFFIAIYEKLMWNLLFKMKLLWKGIQFPIAKKAHCKHTFFVVVVGCRSAHSCNLDSLGSHCEGRGSDAGFTGSSNVESRRYHCNCKHRTQVWCLLALMLLF